MSTKFLLHFPSISPLKARIFTLFLASIGWFSSGVVLAQNDPLLRINTGSEREVTGAGVTFIGDIYYTDSGVGPEIETPILGTNVGGVYQSERIAKAGLAPFAYAIPLADNGTYTVLLHFAETAFSGTGKRVFNVNVEGEAKLQNYDIYEKAGSINTARVETISNVTVSDGILDIEFVSVVERAKVNGIEVYGTAEPVSIPFGINAGGDAYTSASYSWMADDGSYFVEGQAYTKAANIGGTDDDFLYLSERFDPDLRFVLPGFELGLYTIELHFAETNHHNNGERIFDLFIEGLLKLDDFDIHSIAGFSNAHVETFTDVKIADGILNITCVKTLGSATINAIAVTSARSVANEDPGEIERPDSYRLTAAYPNPFNPRTQFSLSVGSTQHVAIDVYNVLGQQVASLYNGTMPAGQDQILLFESGNLPSGIYLVQVRGEHFTKTQQVVLMK